jgi:hypothetical protein
MKTLPLLGCLILAGCATAPKQDHFTPISSVAVTSSLSRATQKAVELKAHITPAGLKVAEELTSSLFDTQVELGKYVGKTDALYQELGKSQEEATYWHDKQVKALKELWLWRSIALASILAVVGFIGLKTSWRFFL